MRKILFVVLIIWVVVVTLVTVVKFFERKGFRVRIVGTPKEKVGRIKLTENREITAYEMDKLFPDWKDDWKFALNLVRKSSTSSPRFVWQSNDTAMEIISAGHFSSKENKIGLDRIQIFSTSTPVYYRYVLLHEMVHAAIAAKGLSLDKEHCYMAEWKMYLEVGKYIGNSRLGQSEQAYYESLCNK